MRFNFVCVGWDCPDFVERTFRSILAQNHQDWRVQIVVDGPPDRTGHVVRDWCDSRKAQGDDRWAVRVNDERLFAVRNQVEAIGLLDPGDDDIIIWLDIDGDRLTHPHSLDRIHAEYENGALLTYGSYKPEPVPPWDWPRARPFSPKVIARNGYRQAILRGHAYFNHPRSMHSSVYRAIPPGHFRFQTGPRKGEWYDGGSDYVFMTAGLELAGKRHRFIPDQLLTYCHEQPHPDYLERGLEAKTCSQDYLRNVSPLAPLP